MLCLSLIHICKFYAAVADDAGVGRPPGAVAFGKICHNLRGKSSAAVVHRKGDAEMLRHSVGVGGAAGAAGAQLQHCLLYTSEYACAVFGHGGTGRAGSIYCIF